jgi:hypothetical protein
MPRRTKPNTATDPNLQAALDALEAWSAPRTPLPARDHRWQAVAQLCAAVLERPARPLRDPLLIPMA